MKVVRLLSRRCFEFVLLGLTLAGLAVGLYLTRGGNISVLESAPAMPAMAIVDQSPLITARHLAAEAHGVSEEEKATLAVRVADHEVDQTFETALHQASVDTTPLQGEALATSEKIAALEKTIEAEKQHVVSLSSARLKTASQDDVAQMGELAQAQLDLDTDRLSDLRQDLIRMGGDKHAEVVQALDEHEAIQKQPIVPLVSEKDVESPQSLTSLPGKAKAYIEIRDRERELQQAAEEASAAAAKLTKQHGAMEKASDASPEPDSGTASMTATIDALHALSGQHKTMMQYDARIHDELQLKSIYNSWADLTNAKRLAVLHSILQALTVIVAIVLAALVGIVVIRRALARRVRERGRLGHYRVITELVVELVALGIILTVIFGTPTQMPAILGLVTAGITIVMRDFIVAFIGWFPLMGKTGIRVGDWVEINGVSGEVVEIGMLRTILLETGNSADAGHPTGRRVTFMNSFAIEGQYFNFSTNGQWLWDELRVKVPRGNDAYHQIEAIRKMIAGVTDQDAMIAEQEWRQATKDEALRGFSAAPTIDLRPASDGIDVTVRYITRAQKRYEMRTSLYQDVIRLLHDEEKPQLAAHEEDAVGVV